MSLTNDPRDPFTRAEALIEQLVDGSFARLFGQRLYAREVATRLAHAVEDNAQPDANGQLCAPDAYDIAVNPADQTALLESTPDLADRLAETVVELAHQIGLRLETTPKVSVQGNAALPLREIRIVAHHVATRARATQMLVAPTVAINEPPAAPRGPQLILHGHMHIALDRPVINIGRRHTNHVVIDDARVSRNHAQVRLRFGHYVIYDLGSTGGTFVNGHRVTECILRHGDVVSLAGVTLVYVEDESGVHHVPTDTQIRPPSSGEPAGSSDPTI
ncbi:MAG: FhaA domain-containing protein [Aggregatilineales bacterium]